jgi:predicted secreted protein
MTGRQARRRTHVIRKWWFRGLLVATIGFAALSVLAGCSSGSSGTPPTSRADAPVTPTDGSTVDATAGKDFVVELESNPTTGFQWVLKNAPEGVTFVSSTYQAPKSGAVGAPTQQLLTFKAVKAGTWPVELVYEQPFAPDQPGQSLSFSVDVAKA